MASWRPRSLAGQAFALAVVVVTLVVVTPRILTM